MARNLAKDVDKRYPTAIASDPARPVSQRRLSDILDGVFARAVDFSRDNKLGWYGRMRLRSEFKWELKEMGYDEKFINMAAARLIACLTRRPPSGA